MSHSKGDEQIEEIATVLDHLVILEKQNLKIRTTLLKGKFPTKEEIIRRLEESKKTAEEMIKRFDYMIKDLQGKNG